MELRGKVFRADGQVIACRIIHQSPLDKSPDVPKGTTGWIQDTPDGLIAVDFEEP